jgi:cellulose synthase (UDP-forming)
MVKPPSFIESWKYRETDRLPFYFFGTFSLILLFTAIFKFSISHPYFYVFGLFGIISFFYLSLSYAIGITAKGFNWHEFDRLNSRKGIKQSVDIFYCCAGEDVKVVQNALGNICRMASSYGPKAKVWVLDDSIEGRHLADAQKIGEEFTNIFYLRRKNVGEWKKAGNLRHAFEKTSAKYIAIFDADFTPRLDYLDIIVNYAQWKHADIVQTPQFFRVGDHSTWVGRGASYVQELFYRLIQVSRGHFNGAICVGTNAVYKRSSLDKYGGTALVAYSEDVRTGFNVIKDGGKICYLPLNLAAGVSPENKQAYILQQHRWALGSISLFFSKEFWTAKITKMQRLCYLSGQLYYIVTGIGLLFQFFPVMGLLIFVPEMMKFYNIIFSLPSFLFGTVFMAYWTKEKWGFYSVMARHLSYYSHLFALIEFLSGKVTPWQPSGANVKSALYNKVIGLMWILNMLNVLVVGLCFYRISSGMVEFYDVMPCLFFTTFDMVVKWKIMSSK